MWVELLRGTFPRRVLDLRQTRGLFLEAVHPSLKFGSIQPEFRVEFFLPSGWVNGALQPVRDHEIHVTLLTAHTLDDIVHSAFFDLGGPERVCNSLPSERNHVGPARFDGICCCFRAYEIGSNHRQAAGSFLEPWCPSGEFIFTVRSKCGPGFS